MGLLQYNRYRGFVQLDYEGSEDPVTAVPRAVRYFRGLLYLVQRQQLLQAPVTAPPGDRNGAEPERAPDAVEDEAPIVR